jgi:hypothetical protein
MTSKSTLYRRAREASQAQDRYNTMPCADCGLARVNVVHHVTAEQQAWAGDSGYFDGLDLHPFMEDAAARIEKALEK